MAPGNLQAGRIAGRVTLQIEGPEMKPSPDRSALFRLSGHRGETHIAFWSGQVVRDVLTLLGVYRSFCNLRKVS